MMAACVVFPINISLIYLSPVLSPICLQCLPNFVILHFHSFNFSPRFLFWMYSSRFCLQKFSFLVIFALNFSHTISHPVISLTQFLLQHFKPRNLFLKYDYFTFNPLPPLRSMKKFPFLFYIELRYFLHFSHMLTYGEFHPGQRMTPKKGAIFCTVKPIFLWIMVLSVYNKIVRIN